MCGLSGFIGTSKKPKATYELITHIFRDLQTRGTDAAGIWGVEAKENPRIVYHKAPIRSSEFVELPIWSKVQKLNPNLLLVHARQTSPGVGHASNNANNHPFVSNNRQIALVHNGKIHEYSFLKDKYQTKTGCDSEILLRMYEAAAGRDPIKVVGDGGHLSHLRPTTPSEVLKRMNGIQDVWSVVRNGSMAVGIGELTDDGKRCLWLFHNDKRPMWIADLRNTLGQIFFFSTVDIWHNALVACKNLKDIVRDTQKLFELPEQEVWYFEVDKNNPVVTNDNHFRFEVERKETNDEWVKGEVCEIAERPITHEILTELDDNEQPPERVELTLHKGPSDQYSSLAETYSSQGYHVYNPASGTHVLSTPHLRPDVGYMDHGTHASQWDFDPDVDQFMQQFDHMHQIVGDDSFSGRYGDNDDNTKAAIADVDDLCKQIRQKLETLETNFVNLALEGTIGNDTFSEVYESLNQMNEDLSGTIQLTRSK